METPRVARSIVSLAHRVLAKHVEAVVYMIVGPAGRDASAELLDVDAGPYLACTPGELKERLASNAWEQRNLPRSGAGGSH